MAGKFDPRWEGKWTIKALKGQSTFEISNGNKCKVVHVNRLRRRIELSPDNMEEVNGELDSWTPPQIDHQIVTEDSPQGGRYPDRTRRQPNWLAQYVTTIHSLGTSSS